MEKEVQQKLIELNLLDAKLRELQQQEQIIEQQIMELQLLNNNLSEISKTEKNTNILAAIGSGIFAESTIKNTDEVFIDIGAKIIAKKSIGDAKELVNKRIENVAYIKGSIVDEMNKIILQLKILEKDIREKISKEQ